MEAAPLEDFSIEVRILFFFFLASHVYFIQQAVRTNLQEALRVASGNGTEEDKLEARIEADVYESLQHALGSK